MEILGIDVGGSGIKGALVDIEKGELITERHRIPTPQPSTPKAVAGVVGELVKHFKWKGPIGCGFPAVVQKGVARTASNIHKGWIGTDVQSLFEKASGCPVRVVNDADAAGMAEAKFGTGQGREGCILLLTLGTGIGSALIIDGTLVPNTELGHLLFKGGIAEHYAADSIRKAEDLSWKAWGKRLNEYLNYVYRLMYPDLIILGGGVSKKYEKYEEFLQLPTPVVPASLLNGAGIVGAALAARTPVLKG